MNIDGGSKDTVEARTYQYRLYPDKRQLALLDDWQRKCHEVYKLCCIQRRIALHRKNQGFQKNQPGRFSQSREVTVLLSECPELQGVPRNAMTEVVVRVEAAYKKSWEYARQYRKRFKHPKWDGNHHSITLSLRGAEYGSRITRTIGRDTGIVVEACIKSLGELRFRQHRPLADGAELKQVHLVRKADGWYISLVCLIPTPAPLPEHPTACIGVDLNVKHNGDKQAVAATSEGDTYYQSSGIKKNAQRLATLQKLVSDRRVHKNAKHADPNSKRTAKRRAKIAKLHQKIARQREHNQQYIAKRLADSAQTVAFEELNHAGMRRKGKGKRKSGLNRALSTAAPGKLIALTEQKAKQRGRSIVKVDAKYTSQICSVCGDGKGIKKGLNVRSWTCRACGAQHDRDINAARNIRDRGLNALGIVQDEPRCTRGLHGEGAASIPSERRSVNREARNAQPVRTQELI